MIHFCTCTGRAASSLEESRKQEVASSCKICGQKPLSYEREALSGSMLSSVGLELTRVIDPDLSWTVPKSSKRATRRARASLTASSRTKLFSGNLEGSEDLIDKDPKRVEDMQVSESEKLGVSILGRRFSDAVENVPIKKRKFPFVRSPSPTPQTPPRPKESECLLKCPSASNQKKSAMGSYAEDQTPTTITAVSTVQDIDIQSENFKSDVDQKNSLTEKNERHGDDADFSGISILAAAACSGNIDCSSSNLEDPASHNSLAAGEASSRFVQNTEPSSLSEELGLKHLPDLYVLDSKTDRNICIVTHLEKNISAATSEDHQEDLKSCKCPVVSISEKSMDVMQDLPAKENETPLRIAASTSQDARSHWDLNVVMDAWESPCDEPSVGSKSHSTLGIVEDGMQKEQVTDFEHCQLKMELGDTKDHSKTSAQHNVGGTAVIDGQDSCRVFSLTIQEMPPHSDSLAADVVVDKNERTSLSPPIIHKPNEVELQDDLGACTRLDNTTCSLGETHCETDSLSNVATVVPEETKPLHSQELVSFDADFTAVAPVECEVGPASLNTCSVAEESTAVHSISFDGERKGEIISLRPIVGEETDVDHTTHPSQPHGAGHVIVDVGTEGKREAVSIADPDKQFRVHITSCDHGGEACHARSPNPSGDLDHMGSNNVSEDGIYSSSVVSPDDKSEDQLMADGKRSEATCLRSPEVEKHVASCTADSDMEPCQLDDSLTQHTSGLLVDGNFSKIIAVDGNAIDRSKPGERSSSHLDSSVHESLNPEEWPTPVTFCQGDKAVAVMKEDDGKTSMVFDVDVKDTGMTTHVHTDPKDKESSKNVDLIARTVDTSAEIGGSVSLKVCQSNEDDLVYGFGEVAIEDSFNSDYDSDDVSLNDNAASAEKVSLLCQADDDYQYEDGEFREPVIHSWGEDEGEEREAERVDYGSDNIDTDPFEPSADHGVVDHDECKEETLSEASRFCQEGKLDGEMNEREPSCQPSLRGSLETKASPAEPGERRAMEFVRRFSRKDLGRKDDSEKLTMDVKVVSELNPGGDKVLVHEELGYRESCHSAILRMKSTGWDRLPDVSRNSRDAVVDVRGSGILKNRVTCLDSSDDRSLRRVFRPTSNRELSSRIDGPNCSDASVRKDKVYVDGNRSNNLDERDSGLAKSIGRGGSSGHLCGRGRAGNHSSESSGAHWGWNCHHSPGYYRPGDHGLPGPKNAAAAAAAKLESSGFVVAPDFTIVRAGAVTPDRVRRQSENSPSQNLHRSLTGRGSSTDRDGALGFGMPLGGHGHVRDISPSRSLSGNRGRSSRYALRVCGTGQRVRYNGPSYSNDIGSSLPIQHPLPRRQRSFSPMPRRSRRSRSRTKSLSRSRSRSPHMWTSAQGGSSSGINRGPGLRRQLSRSPDFRMETRIRRMRSPHRRQGFPEHTIGFVQPPRNHNSPSHASRWIDDRRGDAPDHFREHAYKRTSISERSSPGRGFSRNHRFDLMDSPGRIKMDDYYRPMHSGRFPEFSGGVRGRPRHDEIDDDRRKPGERYGMVDSMRHFDDDGIAKRFRYDVEDGFGNHQRLIKNASESRGRGSPRNFSRGIESRLGSGPKRDGEERDHFRYDRDRKHNVNFKTFGIRERDEDADARRRRPT
ncbi:hypothetical protein AAC387_Pa01g3521 [Persea americana]